jgi:uncharacterized protein (TIGR02001 family)
MFALGADHAVNLHQCGANCGPATPANAFNAPALVLADRAREAVTYGTRPARLSSTPFFYQENSVEMKIAQKMVLAALAVSGAAFAQTKAPEPDYTLSYNIGAVTDYRYRGISQSRRNPALQGGVDYAHKSGFYLGAWASTIQWIKDSAAAPYSAKGPVEIDLYGGYKNAINDTFSYDVGLLQYWYAGNNLGDVPGFANPNTLEIYGALTAGLFTAKYSHSLTNLFGAPDSKGSGYLDLSAAFDLGNGWSITPHVGSQKIKHYYTYTDYSVTVGKDLGDGLSASAAVIGTNKSDFFLLPGSGSKDLGKSSLVLGIKKTF